MKIVSRHEKAQESLRVFNIAILTSIEKVSQSVFAQARITFLKTGMEDIYAKDKAEISDAEMSEAEVKDDLLESFSVKSVTVA